MRIKKRDIEENQDKVNRRAKAEVEQMKKYVPAAKDSIKRDVEDLVGDPEAADDIADMVATNAVSSVYGGEKEVNEVVNGDKVVQFDSERNNEDPFYINGIKWQYVNAIYPDGKKDIAVYRFDHDLAYDYNWFMNEVIPKPANSMNELNQDVLNSMEKTYGSKKAAKAVYYATANKRGLNPETFKEQEENTGEDFGDIPTGKDVEVGADEYEDFQELLKSLGGDSKGINYGEKQNDGQNDLPFESVRPKMSKNQLVETILGKKTRKVLKTIKINNLKK